MTRIVSVSAVDSSAKAVDLPAGTSSAQSLLARLIK